MKKTPGSQFQSGNKFGRGRPQGSRNKVTIAMQDMLDGHGEVIIKKCVLMAIQGDSTALRICMDRLIPPRRDRAVKFALRNIGSATEATAALRSVLRDVADGKLTPTDGEKIAALFEQLRKALQTEDHEIRLRALESGTGGATDGKVVSLDLDSTSTRPEDETNGPQRE